MEMNKNRYQDLMLRFAKELHDVGVTENMKKISEDKMNRVPNVASCGCDEVVRKFYYQHNGYSIEATCTVKLVVKKNKTA